MENLLLVLDELDDAVAIIRSSWARALPLWGGALLLLIAGLTSLG